VDVAGVSVDLAAVSRSRKVVLVEGRSDKAALEVLARRRGTVLGPGGICVVAMGGATSIGHFLELLGPRGLNLGLGGLCDAGQTMTRHSWIRCQSGRQRSNKSHR
jgi:hypothetical protein